MAYDSMLKHVHFNLIQRTKTLSFESNSINNQIFICESHEQLLEMRIL